jgi:hypothetical protein
MRHLVDGQERAIFGGEASRVRAALLHEGLVAVPEVEGVVAAVELVPVQDRLQLRRVDPAVEGADPLPGVVVELLFAQCCLALKCYDQLKNTESIIVILKIAEKFGPKSFL